MDLVRAGAKVKAAKEGDKVQIALNQTPFYAESGGQVGDTGIIKTDTCSVSVTDTLKTAGAFILASYTLLTLPSIHSDCIPDATVSIYATSLTHL